MAEDLSPPRAAVRPVPGDENASHLHAPILPGYRLRRALERNQRFRCDTPIGRMLHVGTSSYREMAPRNAVHITVNGNRISAHVDDVSPLRNDVQGQTHYSWARVFLHTFYVLERDLGRRLRGRNGSQRCNLDCEVVWVDDDTFIEVHCVKLCCKEAECPTCSDEETFPPPAVGRE